MTDKYGNLIYDIGAHKGEDTDYYLKKGFRVIAFEANPKLAAHCRSRFADNINDGRLIMIEGAIVKPNFSDDTVKFYQNSNSVWGTIHKDWAERNQKLGYENKIIKIQTVDFTECLREFGIPYYMKIDIEGNDMVCLEALANFDQRPNYVSIESEKVHFLKLQREFDVLDKLGYIGFKAVQQQTIPNQTALIPSKEECSVNHVFEADASGVFGADLAGEWVNKRTILMQYRRIFLIYKLFGDRSLLRKSNRVWSKIITLEQIINRPLPGWYDTHAVHSSVVSHNYSQKSSVIL